VTRGGSHEDVPITPASASGIFSLFWFENIGIVAWHERPTPESADALADLLLASREQHPSGISLVHIQHYPPEMLTPETRSVFARKLKELGDHVIATAVVTHTSGFIASTLRSMATGILALGGKRIDLRFHERPEELLDWLPAKHEERSGVKVDRVKLRSTLLRIDRMTAPPRT